MAFRIANNVEAAAPHKLYTGIGLIKAKTVCPDKNEITELTGREPQYDISYCSTIDVDGKSVKFTRVTFFVDVFNKEVKNCRLTFKLTRVPMISKSGKIKVIDKYGRTAWVTNDELKAHKIPVFSNGKLARISPDYRPLFKGEENLELFIRALLNLKDADVWDDTTKTFVMREGDDLAKAEGLLEFPDKLFNNDFSELRNIVKLATANTVKALFGVKTGTDGRQYQDIFVDKFVKTVRSEKNTYSDFETALNEAKSIGKYPQSEFQVCPFIEYTVEATDFSNNSAEVENFNPFGDSATTSSPNSNNDDDDLPFGTNDDDPLAAYN